MACSIIPLLHSPTYVLGKTDDNDSQPKKACIMVVVAHPDDEGAFGGTIPFYAGGLKLPVLWVQMTSGDGWCAKGAPSWGPECGALREKEARRAAEIYGMPNPPYFARFPDCCNWKGKTPEQNLEGNWEKWGGRERVIGYLVRLIRTYRPDIIMSHAVNGEYGHGNHMICSAATMAAYDAAGDPDKFTEQLNGLTPWKPKKCYIHNYTEGSFTHHFNDIMPGLKGKSIGEVMTAGIRSHISQGAENWSAGGGTTMGLYGSTVGNDMVKEDFLEHIDLLQYAPYTIYGTVSLPGTDLAPAGGQEVIITCTDAENKVLRKRVIIPENSRSACFYIRGYIEKGKSYRVGYLTGRGYARRGYYSTGGMVTRPEQAEPVPFKGSRQKPVNLVLITSENNEKSHIPEGNWKGEYFPNRNFEGQPSLVRDDGEGFLEFTWGNESPDELMPNNNFSVRWSRKLECKTEGTYVFTATADDGVRLYIDDKNVIDQWIDQGSTSYTARVRLNKGIHSIRIEYYEATGWSLLKLQWRLEP